MARSGCASHWPLLLQMRQPTLARVPCTNTETRTIRVRNSECAAIVVCLHFAVVFSFFISFFFLFRFSIGTEKRIDPFNIGSVKNSVNESKTMIISKLACALAIATSCISTCTTLTNDGRTFNFVYLLPRASLRSLSSAVYNFLYRLQFRAGYIRSKIDCFGTKWSVHLGHQQQQHPMTSRMRSEPQTQEVKNLSHSVVCLMATDPSHGIV